MDYPECPDKYKLTWLEATSNMFVLHCRPYTNEEIATSAYINRLIYTLYVIPILAVGLLCVSCVYSSSRFYRSRKDSGGIPVSQVL